MQRPAPWRRPLLFRSWVLFRSGDLFRSPGSRDPGRAVEGLPWPCLPAERGGAGGPEKNEPPQRKSPHGGGLDGTAWVSGLPRRPGRLIDASRNTDQPPRNAPENRATHALKEKYLCPLRIRRSALPRRSNSTSRNSALALTLPRSGVKIAGDHYSQDYGGNFSRNFSGMLSEMLSWQADLRLRCPESCRLNAAPGHKKQGRRLPGGPTNHSVLSNQP